MRKTNTDIPYVIDNGDGTTTTRTVYYNLFEDGHTEVRVEPGNYMFVLSPDQMLAVSEVGPAARAATLARPSLGGVVLKLDGEDGNPIATMTFNEDGSLSADGPGASDILPTPKVIADDLMLFWANPDSFIDGSLTF